MGDFHPQGQVRMLTHDCSKAYPRQKQNPMKQILCILTSSVVLLLNGILQGEELGKLIFEDNFERNESQEAKEELTNGWGSNSKSRAKGNKQVDLKDGAMHIQFHPEADHAVSVTHSAEFRDGTIEMRFMLEDEKDILGLDFADLSFKEVHAGHLFKVDFAAKYVGINDMKTGNMNLKYYDAKKAGTLTSNQKAEIEKTTKRFLTKIEVAKWHSLAVTISGDSVTAKVDGKEIGNFSSPGFSHATKRMLRLSVPHAAVVDDVKIWAKSF
jgi:hypothetical protein